MTTESLAALPRDQLLAVIGDLFTPRERGRYQGLFGAVFGISALIGPALGGFLTDSISWHWVFYVNLPVGAVALFIIWRLLPPLHTTGVTRKIDYLGVAVFTAALVPILIGLTNAQQHDWTDPLVGGLMSRGLQRRQARNPASWAASLQEKNTTLSRFGFRAGQVRRQKMPVVFTPT